MRSDMSCRKVIVQNSYREYQQAGKKGRGEILDRIVPITGMNRDYLATGLSRYRKDTPVEGSRAAGNGNPGRRGSGAGVRRSTERRR
jgi:hypothetical protein